MWLVCPGDPPVGSILIDAKVNATGLFAARRPPVFTRASNAVTRALRAVIAVFVALDELTIVLSCPWIFCVALFRYPSSVFETFPNPILKASSRLVPLSKSCFALTAVRRLPVASRTELHVSWPGSVSPVVL